MGCDINWYAVEPDKVKQRQAALFVNAVVNGMGAKVSEKPCREEDIYKGFEYAYFLNLDTIDDNKIDDVSKMDFLQELPSAKKSQSSLPWSLNNGRNLCWVIQCILMAVLPGIPIVKIR